MCLWNLGLDPQSRQMICACGAIPLMVNLLESPSGRVRRTMAGALGKLALDDPARVEIARLQGIHKLLYMVANMSEDERETAANALTNITRNDNNRIILKDDETHVIRTKRQEKGEAPVCSGPISPPFPVCLSCCPARCLSVPR